MERTAKNLWLEIIRVRPTKETEETVRAVIRELKDEKTFGKAGGVQVFSNSVGNVAVHFLADGSAAGRQQSSASVCLSFLATTTR
jgi:hypothetical protein